MATVLISCLFFLPFPKRIPKMYLGTSIITSVVRSSTRHASASLRSGSEAPPLHHPSSSLPTQRLDRRESRCSLAASYRAGGRS